MNLPAGPEIVLFLALLVVVAVLIRRADRTGAAASGTEAWAVSHGLTLTAATRAVAKSHRARSRKWRVAGGVIGFVLPFGTQIPGIEMLGGYLIGAILAEITARPIAATDARRASLVPRELAHYLPRYALPLFRSLVVSVLLLAVWLRSLPARYAMPAQPNRALALAVGAVVVLVVAEVALHYIVRRRQPAGDPSLLELDDAIRASAMHTTAGAAISIALLLVSAALIGIAPLSDWQVMRTGGVLAGIACIAAGLVFWRHLGHDTPWRVKRSHDQRVGA